MALDLGKTAECINCSLQISAVRTTAAFLAFAALQVLPSKLAMFRGIDAWVQVLISTHFTHAQAAPTR